MDERETQFPWLPAIDGAPAWLNSDEHYRERWALIHWANGTRGLYGVPIYLVGSALGEDNPTPRDWDIRCCFPDEDFKARFGDPWIWEEEGANGLWTDIRWRWSDECVKRTKGAWKCTELNVDFQIQTENSWAAYGFQPRVQLDTWREIWPLRPSGGSFPEPGVPDSKLCPYKFPATHSVESVPVDAASLFYKSGYSADDCCLCGMDRFGGLPRSDKP